MRGARELCPSARLRYVPNVVDVAAIEPVTPATSERNIIFVANFAYGPNRDGLRFLLEDVLPAVWQELPDATLMLVGPGLKRTGLIDSRVQILGFVEDLHSAYARASCAVVPLLLGGGTPLKLIEALAYGLPVLATPRAVAGLDVRNGEHCMIADGPNAYAAALLRVLRDGDPGLGRRGRALAEEHYSVETLRALLGS